MRQKRVIAAAFLFVLVFCGTVLAADGLGLGAVVLKTTLKTGEFNSKSLNVQGNSDGDFTVKVNAIEGVSVSDESFFLRASEGRNIDVFFNCHNRNLRVSNQSNCKHECHNKDRC